MEGPYRFALQCVCKIERLFSVNVIRTSCLEVATSARVWMGAIVLVLACELAPAAYASEGCSSSASGEPAVEASADAPVSSEAVHPENGWEYDAASNQWFYYQNSAPAKGWLYTGGFWYWFDNEGVMAVGLTECAGGRYLLNAGDDASIPYGAMRFGWVACDDGWRFFNASGAMERCWLLDGSNWYWLDPETGIMATGATQCGSSSYCFGASGAMAFGWAYDRGTWYYADSSGELQSGWLHKWGAWYWLDLSTKAMATGLVNDGSSLYAMGASGAMETGWALVDGAWYHAAESGVLDVGWYWDGSQWYWLDLETRAMATGEFEAYGDRYYALADGAIQMSGWAPCGEDLALLKSNGAVIFVAGKNASGAPVVQSRLATRQRLPLRKRMGRRPKEKSRKKCSRLLNRCYVSWRALRLNILASRSPRRSRCAMASGCLSKAVTTPFRMRITSFPARLRCSSEALAIMPALRHACRSLS